MKFDPATIGEDSLSSIQVMEYLVDIFDDLIESIKADKEDNIEGLLVGYSDLQLDKMGWLLHVGRDICKQIEHVSRVVLIKRRLGVMSKNIHVVHADVRLMALLKKLDELIGKEDDDKPDELPHSVH